jgi:hypothetical protein
MIKVFLLFERKGIEAKGISPMSKAGQGRLIFEPRNTPATQAALAQRSHISELYQSSYKQLSYVTEWNYIADATYAIVVSSQARALLDQIERKGERL